MELWIFYLCGVIVMAIVNTYLGYSLYKKGQDITIFPLIIAVIITFGSWLTFISWVLSKLPEIKVKDFVVIRGKKEE